MDDFDFYRLYKTLHMLAVILLGGGIIVESLIGPMLPRAQSVAALKTLARVGRSTELFCTLPSLLLIPGFGYATAARADIDLATTWLLIAQIVFWIAALISVFFLSLAMLRLHRRVEALPDSAEIPADVREMVDNPVPAILGGLLAIAYVFLVYLMVAKPAW